jgi:predicted porin
MNKNIKLAVAGAVLALSASANAGIIIPAGDWTLDISGNVNTFTTFTKGDDTNKATINGGLASGNSSNTVSNMTTGLLPHFLSVGGSTRQNDIDVAFTISIQPGTANTAAFGNQSSQDNRQAFLTFGDKSWGTFKVGKDLGVFASDAILSDMTLLGVGGGASTVGNTTLGRIGSGYIYADWKPQISYTTPNMNGFQATAAMTQGWNQTASTTAVSLAGTNRASGSTAYEGKASYSFNAAGAEGKVWVSGITQKQGAVVGITYDDTVAYAGDIGANLNVAGFGLTGYYYGASGMGTTGQFTNGYSTTGKQRDSDGGYVQATYILPTKTKVGISWGISNLDKASAEASAVTTAATQLVKSNEMWTVGVYHPLTKHLNIVAEYANVQSEGHATSGSTKAEYQSGSLGAILFF